ncbi:hypothetical protein QTP70_000616 [Hemibagrus guttatus]|uniref:Gypsy retrotransposon integrase-like protein 1 n=1 Tax=Hemibagrus guttatus TaxID=175788 RepID=A0AAE0V8B3_9TELE|nr:hypothetical protein QTP70_000616 [Hemibagrus guttatus]
MDRISRHSQGLEGVQFGDHRISLLIFADDVVLLAPSSLDLQHALGRFAAECEVAGMRVSTSKSEAIVLDRKKVACTLQVGGEVLPQVEEFKYLGVLFTSEGRMDREIDRRIGAAAAVMRSMYRSVVVKKELSRKAKLSIYQSIYVPTLTYGHELWVMTERVRSRIQAAEMSFLRRVAGRSLRDRVRSSVTREELGVEPLLLHIERGQLRWLGHLFRMTLGRLPGEVFQACPTGKRPRGRPRTRWRDYVSRLAWERLGVPPEELGEVSGEREPDSLSRFWVVGAPAHDCYPKHMAPDPYGPSCGWWAYVKVGLRHFFGLCPAESRRQRLGHQALACVPQPQAWLQGGALVTPVRETTVVIGNDPLGMEEMEGRQVQESEGSLLFMEVPTSALQEKVEEACLSNAEKEQLTELLDSFSDLFDGHLGHTSLIEHSIDTGDAKPVHLPPYRTSPTKKQLIEDQIGKMLKEGIIEPATGPWAAPVVIVQKPGGEPRFCVDYRGLNQFTVKDSYPLPRVDESLDFLSRGKFLTMIEAGHLGITKTLARLKLRFFWPKMASEVKKYVISCPVCQLTKPSQRKPAGLMVPIRPQKPWEYVGVDFVGPLPHTSSGNAYILVFVDYFSKSVEIVAVREATAQVAANKLLSEVFSRHGAPTYLISDRGSPFVSDLFERVLAALGTEHCLTTAYHPQTNATERVNRTLKTAIRAYVDDKHTTWDIPQICFALRTAPHESTGQTPSMMLYGRELDTSLDLVTQPVWDGMEEPEVPYSEHLRLSLREAHDHARAALDISHERRKLHYDKRRRSVSYAIGDLVRVKTHPKSDALANFTAKLAPLYSGPYRVT